jgi:hypothetical protein
MFSMHRLWSLLRREPLPASPVNMTVRPEWALINRPGYLPRDWSRDNLQELQDRVSDFSKFFNCPLSIAFAPPPFRTIGITGSGSSSLNYFVIAENPLKCRVFQPKYVLLFLDALLRHEYGHFEQKHLLSPSNPTLEEMVRKHVDPQSFFAGKVSDGTVPAIPPLLANERDTVPSFLKKDLSRAMTIRHVQAILDLDADMRALTYSEAAEAAMAICFHTMVLLDSARLCGYGNIWNPHTPGLMRHFVTLNRAFVLAVRYGSFGSHTMGQDFVYFLQRKSRLLPSDLVEALLGQRPTDDLVPDRQASHEMQVRLLHHLARFRAFKDVGRSELFQLLNDFATSVRPGGLASCGFAHLHFLPSPSKAVRWGTDAEAEAFRAERSAYQNAFRQVCEVLDRVYRKALVHSRTVEGGLEVEAVNSLAKIALEITPRASRGESLFALYAWLRRNIQFGEEHRNTTWAPFDNIFFDALCAIESDFRRMSIIISTFKSLFPVFCRMPKSAQCLPFLRAFCNAVEKSLAGLRDPLIAREFFASASQIVLFNRRIGGCLWPVERSSFAELLIKVIGLLRLAFSAMTTERKKCEALVLSEFAKEVPAWALDFVTAAKPLDSDLKVDDDSLIAHFRKQWASNEFALPE